MENNIEFNEFELCCVIVDCGMGSKILKTAKSFGVSGGTILLGKGTIKNPLLEILDLNDIRKEIVLMISEKSIAYKSLEEVSKKYKFEKPNRGIAFSTPIANLLGTSSCKYKENHESRGVNNIMYNAIFVIVERGKAEAVIDTAELAGSRGGTIINARGSGIHERATLFSMVIEPEKEIVLIISEKDKTDDIVLTINKSLDIEKPGNGIMFVIDLNKTYGLY
jgi:nitrogen regulatory protein PII